MMFANCLKLLFIPKTKQSCGAADSVPLSNDLRSCTVVTLPCLLMTTTISVVFISGFLSPSQWRSHASSTIPQHVNFVTVNPSPTGSLHDRACQIFYELHGGTVDYGKEHSSFHKHGRFGRTFARGKLKKWDANNPIIIIGHSLGGSTAWVLNNYLALNLFPDVDTSGAWVSGIICVNAPLNGALQVHSKGMDVLRPPIVRWGSPGCMVGWYAQWSEFFSVEVLKNLLDFQHGKWLLAAPTVLSVDRTDFLYFILEHWELTWRHPQALYKLFLSILGFCLHSGTDNVAYDVTVRSQLEWAKLLRTLPDTYYISVTGNLPYVKQTWLRAIKTWLVGSEAHRRLYGVDTSTWLEKGSDGLLSVHTQEYPRLAEQLPVCSKCSAEQPPTAKAKRKGRLPRRPTERVSSTRALHIHRSKPLRADELQSGVELQRGVWHTVHREASHLSAALACVDTWTVLMRAVQAIADNHARSPPGPAGVVDDPLYRRTARRVRTKGCTCSAEAARPDRQFPHIGVTARTDTEHTSLGMGYRWGNVAKALTLLTVLATTTAQKGCSWTQVDCLLFGLFALLLGGALSQLLLRLWGQQSGAPADLPNEAFFISDTLAVAFAMWRVWASSTSYASSSVFLWEVALQYVLPRPLLDYGVPHYATVLAVLLAARPSLYVYMDTYATQFLLLVITLLPKIAWAMIYVEEATEKRVGSAFRATRDAAVWCTVLLCVFCWATHVIVLYWLRHSLCEAHHCSAAETCILLLFGVLPLRWFQDLSECFQYVMIQLQYPRGVQVADV
jgi:uncharacterized protein YhhL (DUF1145 family)/pimeloyl-ACP methyl ester carboxylesterase